MNQLTIQAAPENSFMASLGKALGLALGKTYQNREGRGARKLGNEMKADAYANLAKDEYDKANNAANQELTQYVNKFQGQADAYNNAKTDDERNAAATALNSMAKEIDPNFDSTSNMGWTNALEKLKNGGAANFEQSRNNVADLQRKYERAKNYKNAMAGTQVANGTFKDFWDYMNQDDNSSLPQYVPSNGQATDILPAQNWRSKLFNYGNLMPYYPLDGGQ